MRVSRKLNIVELFAGSQVFTQTARLRGHRVFSSDINPKFKTDYTVDIMDFDVSLVPFEPDIVWASPPCEVFSVAAFGANWDDNYTPKHDRTRKGIAVVAKTLEIIAKLKPTYYFIENPRGMLKKLPIMYYLPIQEVCYCKYGDSRMKPTNIWSNCVLWTPRPMCSNGNKNCHHEPAPRGSKTGTQGIKGAYNRAKLPKELCLEIIMSVERGS